MSENGLSIETANMSENGSSDVTAKMSVNGSSDGTTKLSENGSSDGTTKMSENGSSDGTTKMSENGSSNEPELLTKDELQAIHESWKVVWADKKNCGIELFIKLFTHYPEAQDKFNDFKGLTLEEVRVHKKIRAHALSVFYAIKSFIDNLDDLDTLDALIRKNASNHEPRGVGEKEILWLIPPFVELLQEIMPGKVTELHTTAWGKLMGAIASITKDEQEG